MKTPTKTFGDTLRAWRKKRKLSRVTACELIGVKYRTWQDWELGIATPNPFVKDMIISLLGMKLTPSIKPPPIKKGTTFSDPAGNQHVWNGKSWLLIKLPIKEAKN